MEPAYLWIVACFVLLFIGARPMGRGKWNEDVMSLDQTKAFLGFGAFVIVLHHCAQMTCAPWLNPFFIRHGLDAFLNVGYLIVAAFFFCSGYGLYVSAKKKPSFFKRFIPVRILPILIPTAITMLVYVFFRYWRKIPFDIDSPIAVNEHSTWHPYIWYVPCMIFMYICFYIGFGLVKKEIPAILIVAGGSIAYCVYCHVFSFGTWWYNTVHLFLAGILWAKFQKKIFEHFKRFFILRVIGLLLITAACFFISNNIWGMNFEYRLGLKEDTINVIQYVTQWISALLFPILCYQLGMKIRIGNRCLRFLGKFTLELYLVHGIFIHMFGYYMIKERVKPVYYISDVTLFTLTVLACSIIPTILIGILDKKAAKLLRPKS